MLPAQGGLAGHVYWLIDAAGRARHIKKRADRMEREPVLRLLRNVATMVLGIAAVVRSLAIVFLA